MSPQELAAIVARDAEADPYECEYCNEYGPAPAEADRRALLALLRETREAAATLREAARQRVFSRPEDREFREEYERFADLVDPLRAALGQP